MKSTSYFSKLMLIAAAAVATGSCNTKPVNIPFQIYQPSIYHCVIQTQSGTTTSFTPITGFQTISSTSKIISGDVLRGDISLGGNVYFDAWFESFSSANGVTDLTALNGSYTLKATDDKGKPATFRYDMTFAATDVMDLGAGVTELDVKSFEYSAQTITAKITAVGNATDYRFFMVPVLEGAPANGPEIKTLLGGIVSYLVPKTSDAIQTITASFIPAYYDYWIYPVAVRNTNTDILMIFGQGKLLRRGDSAFQ